MAGVVFGGSGRVSMGWRGLIKARKELLLNFMSEVLRAKIVAAVMMIRILGK